MNILHDEQKVKDSLQNSTSVMECLRKLGLRVAGGNYQSFYRACERFNLEPPKYDKSAAIQRVRFPPKPLEEFLVEGSKSSRTHIKRRLLAEGYLENLCSECGMDPIWNDRPLSLQLDHINGIHNDNRIENLRILCPNCHAQTDTFGGKRNSLNRVCPECNAPNPSGKRHNGCVPRSKKIEWPNEEKLRELVDEVGFSATGRKLGVSDNAVRKHLKKLGTPREDRTPDQSGIS